MSLPDVTVVVATRDRPQRVRTLLESLSRQTVGTARFEVVVVDDGSTHETASILAAQPIHSDLRLRVFRQQSARGPAAARNRGWREARAPLIAFTDDDCEADPAWVQRLLAAAHANPGALVQGVTAPIPDERDRIGLFARTLSIDAPGPYFQTCNIAYPRELLERLDGFDEGYPMAGGEDTDLAWRALELGTPIQFAPDARVYHAVNLFGPLGLLHFALRWEHTMRVFGRHPGLRGELDFGLFWKRSHALLLQAVLGAGLASRWRACALLTVPYLRLLRARCVQCGASTALAPYLALYDLVETYATARGGIRYRVAVL